MTRKERTWQVQGRTLGGRYEAYIAVRATDQDEVTMLSPRGRPVVLGPRTARRLWRALAEVFW